MIRDPDSIRLVNCASCFAELLGASEREYAAGLSPRERGKLPMHVYGTLNDRPYCRCCFDSKIASIKSAKKWESR